MARSARAFVISGSSNPILTNPLYQSNGQSGNWLAILPVKQHSSKQQANVGCGKVAKEGGVGLVTLPVADTFAGVIQGRDWVDLAGINIVNVRHINHDGQC
jgi:hypothetical protein